MSLKSTIRRAVKQAFQALDDVPRVATYNSVSGTPIRDLDAGTSHLASTATVLKMVVFARFKEREIEKDPSILLTDTKILFPTEDLKGVVPKASDTMVDDEGTVWEIVVRRSDPASVVTILQARTT